MNPAPIRNADVEDYYPLSPMQEGMLLHTVYGGEPDLYVFQLSCFLRGELDPDLFEEAWQRVIRRHAVLRTFFLWEGLGKPVQVIKKIVKLPMTRLDWRGLNAEDQEEQLELLLIQDRRGGFVLSAAPLMRLTLIQTGESIYRLVWTHHHLLLDGWSLARVLDDVQTCYGSLRRGAAPDEEPSPPYRNFITWLYQQDLSKAKAFWSDLLNDFTAPTPLTMGRSAANTTDEWQEYRRQAIDLSPAAIADLQLLARKRHLTVNILVQGAWALLLSRFSNRSDVVFGAVVSGRPSGLPGITSMVGMFINTLPVRVRIPSGVRVADWLEDLRRQEAALLQYEYTPLVEVQLCSGTPRGAPLFESILAFDNYPIHSSTGDDQWNVSIDGIRSFQRSNYPLAIVAVPAAGLTLVASYDPRRFDDVMILQVLQRLERLLCSLPAALDSTVDELQVLSPEERALLATPSEVRDLEETFLFDAQQPGIA